MTNSAVHRSSGVQTVYDAVRSRIIDGSLAPDARLMEPELARALGVSRTPVREALRLLLAEGLVQQQVTGGVRVSPLREEDLERIYDIRARLEGLLARDACVRMTPAGRAELERLVSLMDRLKDTESEVLRLGRDFHTMIGACADNPWCSQLLHQISGHVDRYRNRSTRHPGRAGDAVEEHRAICTALFSGDPDVAERSMQDHVRRSAGAAKMAMTEETSAAPNQTV